MDDDRDMKARSDSMVALLHRGRIEERHGAGVLVRMHGRPHRATGCLLPDGTTTEARCLALPEGARDTGDNAAIDPAACVWQRRLSSRALLARRGRLIVKPGVALCFLDEPKTGEEVFAGPRPASLERDLAASLQVIERARSDVFAGLLYAALCNTTWRHRATGGTWSCSWRASGGIVAHLRGEGDYMDWYCHGGEGLVDECVLAEIETLGWALVEDDADRADPRP